MTARRFPFCNIASPVYSRSARASYPGDHRHQYNRSSQGNNHSGSNGSW
ncbi:Uncharacterised protein [Mycobacteroides abscessus subsp. abscessus]|nr:Uncharacterised protein [Mycobacteroides abscessus subsp. abscessus]